VLAAGRLNHKMPGVCRRLRQVGHRGLRARSDCRGQVFELDSEGKTGADGMPLAVAIRGVTPSGDAAETFSISAGSARWKSPIDAGTAKLFGARVLPAPGRGPIDLTAWFLEALLARPGKTLNLVPGGKAHAEKRTDLVVGAGSAKRTIAHGPSPASTRSQCRYGRTQAISSILPCLASRRTKNSPSRSGLRNGLRVS
jgi:hypothetical protein